MKKITVCLVLLSVCMLSACGLSGQTATNSNDNDVSTESNGVSQNDEMTQIPTVYSDILNQYATALAEQWDGNALMENELNIIALDLKSGEPLDNIGYAVIDIDGNGKDELVIGTTTAVTDEFYEKMILDLYTIREDGSIVKVLSSSARDRYFYVGEQIFENHTSNSSDDSLNKIFSYDGEQLTDMGQSEDKVDYIQMDLTALNLWTVSDSVKNENNNMASELTLILDEISKSVEVGTAGSSLKAVPITAKLLNWGVDTAMTTDEITKTVKGWMASKESEEWAEVSDQMLIVYGNYSELIGENAKEYLDTAGYKDTPQTWGNQSIDSVDAVFETLGIQY